MAEKPPDVPADPCVVAALFAFVTALSLWLLMEHDDEATEILKLVIGKIKTWVL